ncbi:polysaccharide biosynthesis tyrosine autokinase [Roseomonas stagni]|uniref:Polysaccharide biosynthesis tyrosine autokinase n=1 Tax=Falsiroseomonas algicola TaxID=2716930 RepID=A0A6M1LW17_9PROT|nr:polysaccharide biosynthesis tyrosine autokinase [Falsiroseomonas algicola]NGM24209.1 polysaccharide biosynthesis tyrosine autokinase [Falsiroseomonas algicola]
MLRLLLRSKYIIIACLVLGMLPAVLYVQQTTPLFTAEAQIVVQAAGTNDVLRDRAGPPQNLNDSVMATEVRVASSRGLAARVVAELRLDTDPEFNPELRRPAALPGLLRSLNPLSWLPRPPPPGRTEEDAISPAGAEAVRSAAILNGVLSRLRVTSDRRSFVLTIQFVSQNPEKAARIANAFAAAYVRERLEVSFEDARRLTDWLGARLEGLRQDVATAEGAVERFRSENGLRATGGRQATVNDQQLSELNSRLVIARADLAQRQARLAQVRSLNRGSGVGTSTDVLQSPVVQRLREQETIKARELTEALQVYGERHPRTIGLRAELAELRRGLGSETDRIVTSIANEVEAMASGVASLERELQSLRDRTDSAGEVTVRLRELERHAETSRALYETFLTRFRREGEQQQMALPNARVVSAATIPLSPSAPRAMRIYAAAFLLASGFAIALVFLLDKLDNAVRSADEAEEVTDLPVLAILPRLQGRSPDVVRIVTEQPRSALSDALRGLCTALGGDGEPGQSRFILITSSEPGEGKSFTSAALALTFARAGERVLLIDADTCRPRLHDVFGVPNETGLVDLLAGEATLDAAARTTTEAKLDFMPAGRRADVTTVFQAARFAALKPALAARYTRIIVDTPPVLAVSDVRVLAPLVDEVVFLVKWNATSRDAVRTSVKMLRADGTPPAGIVLAQIDRRRHARYGYGDYGQYYGRYAEYYGR